MAVSHVYTNQVPDGTATSVVRPSDWNSAHNQYYTLSGNTLGASTVSGTNVVLQGGGAVSLSGVGQTIVVYGTNPVVPSSYVSNVNGSSGQISLNAGSSLSSSVNGSSITFGLASNITTALQSANTNYLTTQTVQTQASGNIVGSGFTSTTTTGTAIVGTQNSAGLSLGVPAYLTTAANAVYANLSGATSGNTTASGSTLNLSGINITLSGTNGSQIAISGPPSSGLSNGNNITINFTGSTIGISAQAAALAAGTQTATSGTVNFANSNDVSFGMSGSNQITASFSQSIQTQASGNIAGTGFTSTTTAGTAVVGTLNTAGLSLGVPAYLTAGGGGGAMYANLSGATSGNTTASGNTLNLSGINITLSGTNNSQIAISAPATSGLTAGNNISLSSNGSTIGISAQAAALAAGTQTATSGTVNFANSNGITFGMSGSSQITASFSQSVQTQASGNIAGSGFTSTTTTGTAIVGTQNSAGLSLGVPAYLTAAAGGGGIAAAAGTQTATSGTVNFANSNGITFGMSGSSQITASYTVPTVPTAYVSSVNGSSGAISLNVGSSLSSSTNGSSITFGLASDITTALQSANANYLTSQSNQAFSASGGSSTFQTLNFANSNGLTFSNSGGSVVASYTVPTVPTSYVSNVNGSSGQISLNVGSSLSSSTNGSSITFGLASDITTALQSANANYLTSQSNQAFSASGGSSTFQTLNFANSNGVTFSNSGGSVVASYTVPTVPTSYVSNVNGSSGVISLNVGSSLSSSTNGSSITFGLASNITTALQSTGNYLTTARASNDAVGLNTAQTNVTWTVNSSGISLNAGGYAGTNTSANNASLTLNSNGLTISVAAPGGGGGIAAAAGTQTATSGTINFANSNGVTFGMSGSSQITASYTVPSVLPAYANLSGAASGNTTASGNTLNLSGINITLSGTNNSQIAISAPATSGLTAGNNISLSSNGSTIGISAQAVALGASTQTATSGTVNFANSNGISFGMSGSNQITASYTQSNQAFSASGGSSTFQTLNFANSNGLTFSNSGGSVVASYTVPTSLVAQVNGSSGSVTVAGTGTSATNASITLNSAGLAISVAAPGAANYSIGVSNLGNTAGSTGITGTRIVFVGTNNISLSQSTDANGATISINQTGGGGGGIAAAAGTQTATSGTIVFANSNGVTFGMSGSSQITASVDTPIRYESGYSPHGDYPMVVGEMGQGTLAIDPDIFPNLTLNQIAIPINFSHATNSTGSFTLSNWIGLYSRNASSISLAHSTSFSTGITFSGTANSVSHVGMRLLTYPWSTSVSEGRYWIAQIMRTTTGGANCSFSQYLASQINSSYLGVFGVATNATAQFTLGQGLYSTSTTALPGNIPFSNIRGAGSTTGSLGMRFPVVQFGYNTV
jgi:hypothetical protein